MIYLIANEDLTICKIGTTQGDVKKRNRPQDSQKRPSIKAWKSIIDMALYGSWK